MNLYNMNSDNITMNIDGKDMEMIPAICFGKVYDKWLVSKCGKIWSIHSSRILPGTIDYIQMKEGRRAKNIKYNFSAPIDFWEDGSGLIRKDRPSTFLQRNIRKHQIIMDTWAPLYDNPPEGIVWEEWEIVRDLPTVYNHISKTVVIDHIDDDPTNNHLDNLKRVTSWDNNKTRKTKGI